MSSIGPAVAALTAAVAISACGGRLQLAPAHQIGRLSEDAAVAASADVRVLLRTAAWVGAPLEADGIVPLELTINNGTSRSLSIRHSHFALVTDTATRITPLDPSTASSSTREVMERALAEGALAPAGSFTGFVYFRYPENADVVAFRADLVDGTSGERFGAIEIAMTDD